MLVQALSGCSPSAPTPEAANNSASAAATAPSDAAIPADAKLVVAFGDSLTAGYNLTPGEGFAPVLEKALIAKGIKARVVNAGVSGDTTADGERRLAFVLDGQPRTPDLVILGLGGNDMLRGLKPEETRAHLDAMLKALQQRGIPVLLTGMRASPNMGAAYAAAFDPIYPALAKAYGVPLYPFFLDGVVGHPDLQLSDGIHPNAKGVTVMVAHSLPLIARNLRKSGLGS